MAKNYQYRGDLAETALPEMLFSIYSFGVPGMIEAQREGIVKRIHIKDGCVIHASSTDRSDWLGMHLKKRGKIGEQEFSAMMEARSQSNKRFGVLLIERGLLTPADVYLGIREQIEAIVWSLFSWDSGQVTFSLGEEAEDERVQIQLPMRQVILEGIRRAPDAKVLVRRMGQRETVFEPSFRLEDLIALALGRDEYAVLKMVNGRRSLFKLCREGPLEAAENARLLYAFLVLNLIRPVGTTKRRDGPIKIRFKRSATPSDA